MGTSFLPYVYAGHMIAVAGVLPAVGTVLTGIRFYVRSTKAQGILIDDWLMLAALIATWSMAAVILEGVREDVLGYPAPPPPSDPGFDPSTQLPPAQTQLFKLQYAFQVTLVMAFGLIKLAVLFFYRRVFVVKRGVFSALTWTLIGASVTWMVVLFFITVLECGSRPWIYWEAVSTDGCLDGLNGYSLILGIAGSDLLTDVLIFFLPFPILWKLQMSTKKKLSVSLTLAIGALSLIAAAFRLSIHVQSAEAEHLDVDGFLYSSLVCYWSMLEAGIAVLVVNLPTFGQFLGTRSVQSVIGSVRSMISLQSLGGQNRGATRRASKSGTGHNIPSQGTYDMTGNGASDHTKTGAGDTVVEESGVNDRCQV